MSYLARNFAHEAEVRLLRWSDSQRGATITLELPPLEIGQAHPFQGLEGVRFRMRFDVIRDDETVAAAPSAAPVSSAPAHGLAVGPSPRLNDTPNRSDAARDRYRYTLDAGQKAVVRASLMCKEEKFWRWQERTYGYTAGSIFCHDVSAAVLRQQLGIKSRSEIASNEEAYRRFLDLEFAYRGHAEERG